MTVFGAVFARGGSKGVARKNLRRVGGASLLELAVSMGSDSTAIDRIFCSTDSREIADLAARSGAEVPFIRPSRLSRDDSPEWGAWRHLVDYLLLHGASMSDTLVSLPPTSPLRIHSDIDRALNQFAGGTFDVVLGVTETNRNPWFNMVSRDESGRVSLLAQGSGFPVFRRQDAPEAFDITTVVYVTTLGFVSKSPGLLSGQVGSITVPRERSIDIDTELDLEIANYLVGRV